MSDDKEQEWVDPVLGMLDGIRQYAKNAQKNPERTQDEYTLATCIEFIFAHMERKSFDEAPLLGPEVDEQETQETKMDRVQGYAAMQTLIDLGIIPGPKEKK